MSGLPHEGEIMKVRVTGAKFFEGNIDGKSINSGKLYTECKLDDSRGNAKGFFTEEWKVTSELVKRILHLPFPFECELVTERVGNGRESREVVIDLRPVDMKPSELKKAA
jgi:hypothetical protein